MSYIDGVWQATPLLCQPTYCAGCGHKLRRHGYSTAGRKPTWRCRRCAMQLVRGRRNKRFRYVA